MNRNERLNYISKLATKVNEVKTLLKEGIEEFGQINVEITYTPAEEQLEEFGEATITIETGMDKLIIDKDIEVMDAKVLAIFEHEVAITEKPKYSNNDLFKGDKYVKRFSRMG